MNDFGLVLRSELYTSKEVLEFARLADDSEHISHLLFPDIPNGYESIELSTASLALTKRIKVGTGVLRLAEYNPELLARRLQTIQFLSGNRFVLGIGAGSPGPKPGQTIARMFSSLEKTKESFISSSGWQLRLTESVTRIMGRVWVGYSENLRPTKDVQSCEIAEIM